MRTVEIKIFQEGDIQRDIQSESEKQRERYGERDGKRVLVRADQICTLGFRARSSDKSEVEVFNHSKFRLRA
jgi:hypothetical protein